MKIGDFVRIKKSCSCYEPDEYIGKITKIFDTDFPINVSFLNSTNNFAENELIKIKKIDWLIYNVKNK